jgi:hypothetical protein
MTAFRDPVPLLRFALASGDRALAETLVCRFARSPTLAARAMRDLAGLEATRSRAADRSYRSLVLMLGIDD